MQQFNANQVQQEEKPKHNIFSSENYGIGRLEFLGCFIVINIMLYFSAFILAFVISSIGVDRITTKIFTLIIVGIAGLYLFTQNYAHRLYHIGWTDEMNSKTIAGLLMFVCLFGSAIPILGIFAVLLWFILTALMIFVPGENE